MSLMCRSGAPVANPGGAGSKSFAPRRGSIRKAALESCLIDSGAPPWITSGLRQLANLGQLQSATGLVQRTQVFAQCNQIGLVGLQFGQALGLQQVAHFAIELVAELA